ncbi:putative oxidoreductase YgfF [Abditibacteriota bacterium]|nr:putative oxidoreductase YgfF [Abditibacteriota bacterium]
MQLENKIALVTGGSRGIGRAIALRLASEGAFVWVNYTKHQEAAHEVVAQIEAAGGHAQTVHADISDLGQIETLFGNIEALDILVNNAGYGDFVPFDKIDAAHFDGMFNLNVRGLFFTTRHALRVIRDGGRIVNISSIASRGFSGEGAVYASTKAAVNAFTTAISKDVGARGITVNAVSPGPVQTELFDVAFDDEAKKRMASNSVFNRIGQTDDIADIVAFLCSDGARWITGREIVADGGVI